MKRFGYSRPVLSPLSGFALFTALILGTIPATGEVVLYRAPEDEVLSTDYQVWVDGKKIVQPVLLQDGVFYLGGDPQQSTRVQLLETSARDGAEVERLHGENARLLIHS